MLEHMTRRHGHGSPNRAVAGAVGLTLLFAACAGSSARTSSDAARATTASGASLPEEPLPDDSLPDNSAPDDSLPEDCSLAEDGCGTPEDDPIETIAPAPTPITEIPAGAGDSVFTGTAAEFLDAEDPDALTDAGVNIVIDQTRFVAGDTLGGTIEFLGEPTVLDAVSCLYLAIQFVDVARTSTTTYEGTATGETSFDARNCSGVPDTVTPLGDELALAAVVDGDQISVTVDGAGDSITFVAERDS